MNLGARAAALPDDERRRLRAYVLVGAVLITLVAVGAAAMLLLADDPPPLVSDAGLACGENGMRGDRTFVAVAALTAQRDDLLPACFGGETSLAPVFAAFDEITPAALRERVAYLGVFDDDSDVVAFSQRLSGGRYVLALHRDAVGNPGLRSLTIAHELAHVVVGADDQFVSRKPGVPCPTVATITGCLAEDSLLLAWIGRFWSDADLAAVDLLAEPEISDGEARCAADPAFLSPYAAADPEEDLAETVSAYVLDVDVPPEVQPRLDFVAAIPAFQQLRDHARANGVGPLSNGFESCG